VSKLGSFGDEINVAVIGASGGIGGAFCEALAANAAVKQLFAFSRREATFPDGTTAWHAIDISDENSIKTAAASLRDAELDLVLVLSGILHRDGALRPERRLAELEPEALAAAFAINATGPALVAKHFLPKLRRRKKTVFAALSARVGSISDNRLGGWASYRASKAALNQLVKTIAIEHGRQHPHSIVVTLHPGTVDTALSKPFTRSTPDDKLFSPQQSAAYLLRVIDELEPADNGGLFAWDGSRIEF
jgi:NAD(P)-dependent dehydrogenase (short-subunit alcohol dehydrogenase family)